MTESNIVMFDDDGNIVVDSRVISKKLGIKHASFLRNIRKHEAYVAEFGPIVRKSEKANDFGRQLKYCLLNEAQALFVMTLSRNTDQAVDCKIELVQALSKAKAALKTLIQPTENLAIKAWVLNHPQQ